ncbi:MAG TPA: galactokinase family protein [Candidatus Binatia bacterium]|nr:galactokinase family protein [Candidatus Binatia bacterium]
MQRDPRNEVITLFKKHFAHKPPHVVRAPGRLELLGNHTDYNQGLVLALAVDKFVYIASASRTDGRIEVASSAFPERARFSRSQLEKNPAAPWADYVKGVLNELRKRGVPFTGFNAAVHSTLPMGAGLSSSAAIEVATALTIRKLKPYSLTETGITTPPQPDKEGVLPPLTMREKLEIAKACQAAENNFVGVQCGLLDQISSLFGKAFHAIEIDFQSLAVEPVPMVGEIAIVVCNTGIKHALVGGEYNALRAHCESAAKTLGVKSLRSVDAKMLSANRAKLSERDYQCALHIVGEIQRVVHGARALRDEDFEQFGQYMFQSHESSRDNFKNSTPELDILVELARKHPACLGARLTGGGFGGATINLVRRDGAQDFIRALATQYGRVATPLATVKTEPMLCQVVDGAG